ncbi:Putative Glutaredoxin [Rhizopus microsporus]|nr:Putative Glutaredoxin [Rhizopus microsporus]
MSAIANGVKEFVKKAIADNKVTIFSKTYCGYSIRAKDLFDDINVDYKAIELNERPDGVDIQECLKELTKQSTVPNVFINQQHVGGYSDLESAYTSGKLKKLLQEAGIDTKNL